MKAEEARKLVDEAKKKAVQTHVAAAMAAITEEIRKAAEHCQTKVEWVMTIPNLNGVQGAALCEEVCVRFGALGYGTAIRGLVVTITW